MGQYYKVLNLTKKEFLNPHTLGDGLKLMEFGASGEGTMLALAVLLVNSNGRGGGDFNPEHPKAKEIVGRWAGDEIVIAGDYADNNDKCEGQLTKSMTLYELADSQFTNISLQVREVLASDKYTKLSPRWDN